MATTKGARGRLFLRRYEPDQVQRVHGFIAMSQPVPRCAAQGSPEQARSIGGAGERIQALSAGRAADGRAPLHDPAPPQWRAVCTAPWRPGAVLAPFRYKRVGMGLARPRTEV